MFVSRVGLLHPGSSYYYVLFSSTPSEYTLFNEARSQPITVHLHTHRKPKPTSRYTSNIVPKKNL